MFVGGQAAAEREGGGEEEDEGGQGETAAGDFLSYMMPCWCKRMRI